MQTVVNLVFESFFFSQFLFKEKKTIENILDVGILKYIYIDHNVANEDA